MHSAGQTHSYITESALCFKELKEIPIFNKSIDTVNDFRKSLVQLDIKRWLKDLMMLNVFYSYNCDKNR